MIALMLALPFVGTVLLLLLRAMRIGSPQPVALAVTGASLAVLAWLTLQWDPATPLEFVVPWVPMLGLEFSLWLDGPALFWAWLVLGIGFGVVHYAGHYMDPSDAPWRFYAALLFFMGSMLGVVISQGLLLMFVFWEMTSVSSFVLIGHWHHKESARQGARRALLLTASGGLAMMAGIALIAVVLGDGTTLGSLDWRTLWERGPEIVASPWAPAVLILLLLGVFTKSAQFPFHFWLPGAMEAPTPVSAYLHAATMVKAGIYLLGRIYPVFQGMELWLLLVGGAGLITMLMAGWLALFCKDIKQLLAYSTVSQLGLLTAYYGLGYNRVGTEEPLALDLMLVASHALFKAGLFMLCGSVDHGTHTRLWTKLGGLRRKMPVTTWLTVLGCVSMAGLPLSLGFVAKKLLVDLGLQLDSPFPVINFAFLVAMIIGSCFTMAYCVRLAWDVFFGKPRDAHVVDHAHESGWGMLAAPFVLIGLCILAGIWVPLVETPLSNLVQRDFYGSQSFYKVAMFKKLDLAFLLTVIIVGGGIAIHRFAVPMERWFEGIGRPAPFLGGFDRLFGDLLTKVSGRFAAFVHNPSMQTNLAIIFCVAVVMVATPLLLRTDLGEIQLDGWNVGTIFGSVTGLMICSMAIAVATLKGALSRVLALSLMGVLVGGYFVLYKAPDLGIVQVLVELVVLLVLLLMLKKLGRFVEPAKCKFSGAPAVIIAACSGMLMAALTFFAATSPMKTTPPIADNMPIKDFYILNSKYPMEAGAHSGGGYNVVNVVLVDYRALDTLGEMIVVVIAALGIIVLLTGGGGKYHPQVTRQTRDQPAKRMDPHHRVPTYPDTSLHGGNSVIVRTLAKPIGFLALAFSVVLFFAGHNAPGGGFIGGLLAAIALVPFLLGFRHGEDGQPKMKPPIWLLPAGMFAALIAAVVPPLLGYEFLRTAHKYVHIPLLGEVELASALVFDLGIYFAVVGGVLCILKYFWREGGR